MFICRLAALAEAQALVSLAELVDLIVNTFHLKFIGAKRRSIIFVYCWFH